MCVMMARGYEAAWPRLSRLPEAKNRGYILSTLGIFLYGAGNKCHSIKPFTIQRFCHQAYRSLAKGTNAIWQHLLGSFCGIFPIVVCMLSNSRVHSSFICVRFGWCIMWCWFSNKTSTCVYGKMCSKIHGYCRVDFGRQIPVSTIALAHCKAYIELYIQHSGVSFLLLVITNFTISMSLSKRHA